MLQNTRKYDIERVLWKAKPADVDKLAEKLAKLANEFARRSPRSTSTRHFPPAASMPPVWWFPPRWKRWHWASTKPSSSTAT